MYVKKFEADTIDEALKAVKFELGPDAIILRTITNKGLKGAFRKKKIEVTAAISEKNYAKKAKVDQAIGGHREDFYKSDSSSLKSAIDNYNRSNEDTRMNQGYGQLGLNKMVNTLNKGTSSIKSVTQKTSDLIKSSLDDFLDDESDVHLEPSKGLDDFIDKDSFREEVREKSHHHQSREHRGDLEANDLSEIKQLLRSQQHQIELLEQKIFELSHSTTQMDASTKEDGLGQLRKTLRTLEIEEGIIVDLIRKATYELSHEEQLNSDLVFNFALKEMNNSINVEMPLFSQLSEGDPVVTVLLSEAAAGQTSMATKIAVLKKDVVMIQYASEGAHSSSADFAAKVFDIEIKNTHEASEVFSLTKAAIKQGKSVLLDVHLSSRNNESTKGFIESLRRGFNNVEVLLTLSAIHSEIYNRKILSRYKELANGTIISHIDLCLNFGAIFNIHRSYSKLPMKFFGTGPIVPDDIESATSERVMAGLFQLD